jgi:hypothetical protein
MITAANAHGYTVALGDCYPFDVNIKNATVIRYPCVCGGACVVRLTLMMACVHHSRYIKWKVRDGSVIIVHDGRKERRFTIDVLKSVLPHLKEVPPFFFVLRFVFRFRSFLTPHHSISQYYRKWQNGFEVVTLSELMASS